MNKNVFMFDRNFLLDRLTRQIFSFVFFHFEFLSAMISYSLMSDFVNIFFFGHFFSSTNRFVLVLVFSTRRSCVEKKKLLMDVNILFSLSLPFSSNEISHLSFFFLFTYHRQRAEIIRSFFQWNFNKQGEEKSFSSVVVVDYHRCRPLILFDLSSHIEDWSSSNSRKVSIEWMNDSW